MRGFVTLSPGHLVKFGLAQTEDFAIVRAPLSEKDQVLDALPVDDGRLERGIRATLALVALGWIAVFAIAWWLRPDSRGYGTHEQLGLPPCTFYQVTKIPCPSCGMTTSFCHFAHGDLVGSLHANPVGTFLAAVGIVLVPWLIVSACWGRRFGVQSYEIWLTKGVIYLLILLIVNWAIVAGWCWWNRI